MKKMLSLLLALTMLLTCASAMAEIPATFHAEGMPIVYPFIQKYFDQGVMIGAVKG